MEETRLKRRLSWVEGTALTIGAVLGSGILILPVAGAQMAGPASLLAWILMSLLAVPIVLTLGALARICPEAGGIAAYAEKAFGPQAGAVTGWLFLGTVPIGAPVAALIGADSLAYFFPLTLLGKASIAAVLLGCALLLNYRGVQLSGRTQMAVVTVIALLLIGVTLTAWPDVRSVEFEPFAPQGWWPVGKLMALLFWAFVGWEMIAHLVEEFKAPQRDIPVSLGLALISVTVLYLGMAFVTVGTGVYKEHGGAEALAILAGRSGGIYAGGVVALLGLLVSYGTIHTYLAGFSRLVYAQARQGQFSRWFAVLHPRYFTPYRVFMVLAVWYFLLLLGYVLGEWNLVRLMELPSVLFIALYLIAMASALRILRPFWQRGAAGCSFLLCLCIGLFMEWTWLYPGLIGLIGYFASKKNRLTKRKS